MIVFSTKIAKGERRGKEKTKVFIIDYAEPTPVFYKDSERRAPKQGENESFRFRTIPKRLLFLKRKQKIV